MIHPEHDDVWGDFLGVLGTYVLVIAVLAIVILTGIGAYTVFTWLA